MKKGSRNSQPKQTPSTPTPPPPTGPAPYRRRENSGKVKYILKGPKK